ncbi:MAG: AAA-like domain-containing protein [Leptolyngbyaceae cyanobacterium]
MSPDEVLSAIEERFLRRSLTPAERIVLGQTWNQRTYDQMAQQSGYGDAHLKDTGYKLWREISQALGQRVTKKSLLFVLQDYLQSSASISSRPSKTKSRALTPDRSPVQYPYPAGPLPYNSRLYIHRPPNEEIAHAAIQQPGGLLRIKAPQKMGKTSLVFQLIQTAKKQGLGLAYIDLQAVDSVVLSELSTFLKWLCSRTSQELQLQPKIDEYWEPLMGHKVSSEIYFQEYILKQHEAPVVLIISAAEDLIEHVNLAQDFFPLLRAWHEKAKWSSIWRNLRIVIVHSTEIYVPLKISQSPFNIGQSIKLPGFTVNQIYELASRYGLGEIDQLRAERLLDLTGGHPYLINIFFYYLAMQGLAFADLMNAASTPSGIYGTHLRQYLALLNQESDLVTAFQQVISTPEPVELDAITLYRLESLGLVNIQGYRAVPSCQIYRLYFQQQLGI